MGARGRDSLASLSVAAENVSALPKRPDPWPGLNEREAELWVEIVNAQSIDWFRAGDMPILAAYCRAIALHEQASSEAAGQPLTVLGSSGVPVVNPILKVQDMAAKQIASLAVKLRLSQSAKWTEQKAATKHNSVGKPRKPWE